MGSDEKDRVSPGRLSGQGSNNVNGETASPREGWSVVLPVPGGGDEGGGDHADSDIDPPEAEHGRAIYCDAADSGTLRGGSKTDGCTGTKAVVGTDGDLLKGGQGKGGSNGRSGGAGVDGLGLGVRGRHTEWDHERHGGGGVPGSKRFQWSGVEWGGVLNPSGGDLNQVQCSYF